MDPEVAAGGMVALGIVGRRLRRVVGGLGMPRGYGGRGIGQSRLSLLRMSSNSKKVVRRHINWNNHRPDLKEDLAHLVKDIKRRICGIASASPVRGKPSLTVS